MGKVEVLMVAVLICLSLLLGLLFGGSLTWYLKPSTGGVGGTTEKIVNKYVCSDGAVKDKKTDCPVVEIKDGQTNVVCPPCNCDGKDFTYTECSCTQCKAKCGLTDGGITTTTLAQPICESCTADSDCGIAEYGDLKCNKDKMYKLYNEPICSDGCCKTKQTRYEIRSCMENEICKPTGGCVQYEETTDEE